MRDVKNHLNKLKETLYRDLRTETRESNASLIFNNKMYANIKEQLKVALSETLN